MLPLRFRIVRREWSPDELVESWTLIGVDWQLVGNKTGATRLGFAVLLKFFEVEARFPRSPEEVPAQAVVYLAEQVKVEPAGLRGVPVGWPVDQVPPGADSLAPIPLPCTRGQPRGLWA